MKKIEEILNDPKADALDIISYIIYMSGRLYDDVKTDGVRNYRLKQYVNKIQDKIKELNNLNIIV